MIEEEIVIEEENTEENVVIEEENTEENVLIEEETINIINGTNDYLSLNNKPQINGIELIYNKSFEDLGAVGLTNREIEDLLNNQA